MNNQQLFFFRYKIICIIALIAVVSIIVYGFYSHKDMTNCSYHLVDESLGVYELNAVVTSTKRADFSDSIYELVKADFERYDNMSSEDRRTLSSHLWGLVSKNFDTWDECEAFVGITTKNPLEEYGDFIPADSKTGLILNSYNPYSMEYSHCSIECYGTRDGKIKDVTMNAGYQQDDFRITLNASRYGITAGIKGICYSYTDDDIYRIIEQDMVNGTTAIIIVPCCTNNNSMADIYYVDNHILYNIHIVKNGCSEADVLKKAEELILFFEPINH